jgi:thioredoxin 1
MGEFTELTDTSFKEKLAATHGGIVLFYKELCPHCKNMEKVLAKFSAKAPEIDIMVMDSEACPDAMTALGVERVPTLVIIKGGQSLVTKAGLMNPKELRGLYQSA